MIAMITIEDITEQLRAYYPQVDSGLLARAGDFCARAHQGQKTPDGRAYLHHPFEVASILARLKVDVTTIVVGLLHDSLGTGQISKEDLSAEFGEEVVSLIEIGNKISSIPYRQSNQQQVESFRKMFIAMARDLRVVLVYLADRLSDMRTILFRDQQAQHPQQNHHRQIQKRSCSAGKPAVLRPPCAA